MTEIPDDIMEMSERALYAVHADEDPAFGTRIIAIALLAAEKRGEERERERLSEPLVKSFQFEDGSFNIVLTGPAVEHMAAAFVGHFKAMGAENYFEMNLFDREEPYQRYTVTVQKVSGKSPADKVKDAEARIAELEAKLAHAIRKGSD